MDNQDIEINNDKISLIDVSTGKQVRIFAIEGGCKLRSRLAGMGLFPGVEVKVIRSNPFIIGINGSRLVLGRGMACKINVYSDNK